MNFEPQCKTQEQLHLEMARVCRMCEGTEVNVWRCVKVDGLAGYSTLNFKSSPLCYEFAIAIVEGKPVFRGDELYHANYGNNKVVINSIDTGNWLRCTLEGSASTCINTLDCSWLPPKPKTLTIELPYDDVVYWASLYKDFGHSFTTSDKNINISRACGKALDKI